MNTSKTIGIWFLVLSCLLCFTSACEKKDEHEDDPGAWEDTLAGSISFGGVSFEIVGQIDDTDIAFGPQGTLANSEWKSPNCINAFFEFDYNDSKGYKKSLLLESIEVSGTIGHGSIDCTAPMTIKDDGIQRTFNVHITGEIVNNVYVGANALEKEGPFSGEIVIFWEEDLSRGELHIRNFSTLWR